MLQGVPMIRTRSRQPWAATAVVAALAVALAGCGSGAGSTASGPAPTDVPSATPGRSAEGSGAPVPAELRSRWMGGHRDLPGVSPLAGTTIQFEERTFALTQSEGGDDLLRSSAASTPDHQLRLALKTSGGGCRAGDEGSYTWALSTSGRVLTIAAVDDACRTRLESVPGQWWHMGCKDPGGNTCLGDLDAGTYQSRFIGPRIDPGATWASDFGAVTYTVPDNWANDADWPTRFSLVPSVDFAKLPDQEPHADILLFTQPIAQSQENPCSVHDGEAEPGVGRTVDDLIAWLRGVPGLQATDPVAITIDGHPGQWVDLTVEPGWTSTCEVLEFIKSSDGGPVAIAGEERERLILLDLGQDDVLGIRIFSWDPDRFDAFLGEAMPIIESFRFE